MAFFLSGSGGRTEYHGAARPSTSGVNLKEQGKLAGAFAIQIKFFLAAVATVPGALRLRVLVVVAGPLRVFDGGKASDFCR
jgi:hypothetical protein